MANLLHPLASAAANGNDALLALEVTTSAMHGVAFIRYGNGLHRGFKVEIHFFLQLGIEIFQHQVVDVRAQVTHGSIQQVQVVLNAKGLEPCAGRGVQLSSFTAVTQIDFIHVAHQLQRTLFPDILVQRTTEIVGDIVLAIRECACAAESAHNGTALAAYAGLYFYAVNGAMTAVQRVTRFEHGNLEGRFTGSQFVSGEDTAGTCTDDDNVILIHDHSSWMAQASETVRSISMP